MPAVVGRPCRSLGGLVPSARVLGRRRGTSASHPASASSTADARTGVEPMFVSPTLASAIEPLSRRTAAATPTIAHACAVRWNFS